MRRMARAANGCGRRVVTATSTASATIRGGCDRFELPCLGMSPGPAPAPIDAAETRARPGRVRGRAQRDEREHAPRVRARRASSCSGASAAAAPTRRRSTTAPCGAIWPTCRRAGSRARRPPARPRRSGPTSAICGGAVCSAATSPRRSRRPRARAGSPHAEATRRRRRCSTSLVDQAAASDDPRALRDLAVVELLYGAGLRVSECCGLDVGDVDLRRRTVTVLGKGAKVRRLPLGEPARDAVAGYLQRSRRGLGALNPVPGPSTHSS